jgi:hypothetical protein
MTTSEETKKIVADVLDEHTKKNTNGAASSMPTAELSPPIQALIALAFKRLPDWVKYVLGAGGGVIAAQLIAIWGLPQRVDQIEQTQLSQGALLQKVACRVGAIECPEEKAFAATSRPKP